MKDITKRQKSINIAAAKEQVPATECSSPATTFPTPVFQKVPSFSTPVIVPLEMFSKELQQVCRAVNTSKISQTIKKDSCLNIKSHPTEKLKTQTHVHDTFPLESLNLALAATSAHHPFVSLGKGSVGSYLRTGSFPLGGAGISA